jgi:hypothetical protein
MLESFQEEMEESDAEVEVITSSLNEESTGEEGTPEDGAGLAEEATAADGEEVQLSDEESDLQNHHETGAAGVEQGTAQDGREGEGGEKQPDSPQEGGGDTPPATSDSSKGADVASERLDPAGEDAPSALADVASNATALAAHDLSKIPVTTGAGKYLYTC